MSWRELPAQALRDALLPSQRTAPPASTASSFTSLAVVCSTNAPHASDRAYPSVCLSNVWHLPVADVMPAIAKGVCAPSGLRMRFTAITSMPWKVEYPDREPLICEKRCHREHAACMFSQSVNKENFRVNSRVSRS